MEGWTKVEMEAGLGAEMGAEWVGMKDTSAGTLLAESGLEPPFPFYKQCLAYLPLVQCHGESSNAKTGLLMANLIGVADKRLFISA